MTKAELIHQLVPMPDNAEISIGLVDDTDPINVFKVLPIEEVNIQRKKWLLIAEDQEEGR